MVEKRKKARTEMNRQLLFYCIFSVTYTSHALHLHWLNPASLKRVSARLRPTCFPICRSSVGSLIVQTTHLVSGKPAFELRPKAKAVFSATRLSPHQPVCVVCVK